MARNTGRLKDGLNVSIKFNCGLRLCGLQKANYKEGKGQYKRGSSKDSAPRLTQDLGQGQTIGIKPHGAEDYYPRPFRLVGPSHRNPALYYRCRALGSIIPDGRSI
jgi:hypothetical protein